MAEFVLALGFGVEIERFANLIPPRARADARAPRKLCRRKDRSEATREPEREKAVTTMADDGFDRFARAFRNSSSHAYPLM
jgi:hypothetical protein